MRSRSAFKGIPLVLVLLVAVLAAGCKDGRPSVDGARLDIGVTGAKSPEQIENMVRASLAEKYSPTNLAEGYTMYYVTNGPAHWVFVQAANAPRGLGRFNLYCYEWKRPDLWLLTGYVPEKGVNP
jgi:hypothetical protein